MYKTTINYHKKLPMNSVLRETFLILIIIALYIIAQHFLGKNNLGLLYILLFIFTISFVFLVLSIIRKVLYPTKRLDDLSSQIIEIRTLEKKWKQSLNKVSFLERNSSYFTKNNWNENSIKLFLYGIYPLLVSIVDITILYTVLIELVQFFPSVIPINFSVFLVSISIVLIEIVYGLIIDQYGIKKRGIKFLYLFLMIIPLLVLSTYIREISFLNIDKTAGIDDYLLISIKYIGSLIISLVAHITLIMNSKVIIDIYSMTIHKYQLRLARKQVSKNYRFLITSLGFYLLSISELDENIDNNIKKYFSNGLVSIVEDEYPNILNNK